MAQGANGDYNLKVKVAVESSTLEVAKRNIRTTREETQKFTFDMNTLSNVARAGVGILREFGVASLLSLGGIAATAPSLAGSMATIETAAFGVSDSLGKALKPVFDWFGDALKGVDEFLRAHPFFAQLAGGAIALSAAVGVASASITFLWGIFGPLIGTIWTLVGPTALGALQTMLAGFSTATAVTAITTLGTILAAVLVTITSILAGMALIAEYSNAVETETSRESYAGGTHLGHLDADGNWVDDGQTGSASSPGYIPWDQRQNSNPNGIGNDPNWHGAGSDFQGGRDFNINLTIYNQSGQIVDYTKLKYGTNTTGG